MYRERPEPLLIFNKEYMAKFCNNECKKMGPICDFCEHYDFNGIGKNNACYNDNGMCRELKIRKDPEDGRGCQLFECFNCKNTIKNH